MAAAAAVVADVEVVVVVDDPTLEQIVYSVRPKNYEHLTPAEQEYFDLLDAYQAPYLKEKMLATGEARDDHDYGLLFCEFKKYVALLAISQENLGMVGQRVDILWHQFILFTRQYHIFSQDFYGKYIHHTPYTTFTPTDPEADKRFYNWYHKLYGCPPPIWKEKAE